MWLGAGAVGHEVAGDISPCGWGAMAAGHEAAGDTSPCGWGGHEAEGHEAEGHEAAGDISPCGWWSMRQRGMRQLVTIICIRKQREEFW